LPALFALFPHAPHKNIYIGQKSCWKETHSHPAVSLILDVLKDVQQELLNVLSSFDQRKLPMKSLAAIVLDNTGVLSDSLNHAAQYPHASLIFQPGY
jgi:hypothetical protein